MRTIRADAFEHVSFGLHSVVATHKATNWKYYPSSPLKADVRIIVNDQTIGVYSVQNEDGDTEEVTVKFMSDFLPCKRCHLICDPLEPRPFGACRWHTKAPLRLPLREFKTDPSMLSDTISVNELVAKLRQHVTSVADAPSNYYYGSLRWLDSRLETVVHRYNVDTRLMVKIARHKYDAFDDALNGNDYDAQMPVRLSAGKFSHERWTCCGQTRKDAIGCWIGDHSFTSVDPCLHDASQHIRGSEHITLSQMRDIHTSIDEMPTLADKVRLEASFNAIVGAIYLQPEMMWVVSPTNTGVIDLDVPVVNYPQLEREFRAVNTARELYRYEVVTIAPKPQPVNVESTEEVEKLERKLTLTRLVGEFDPSATRMDNTTRLIRAFEPVQTPSFLIRTANTNKLMQYTPCLLSENSETYARNLLADIASVVFGGRPLGNLKITNETHNYFRARDMSRSITQDIVECQRRVQVDDELRDLMNDVLGVTFSLKPTFYRAALPAITSALRLYVETNFGEDVAKTYVQLSWLLHSSLYGQVTDNNRAIEKLIANRLNIVRNGRLLEGFSFRPKAEGESHLAHIVIGAYIRLFATGYFFAKKTSMPVWVVRFMEQQLLFIEMLNVVYEYSPLHTVESDLIVKDHQVESESTMSLIDRLMADEFEAAVRKPIEELAVQIQDALPIIGQYYLSGPIQNIDMNAVNFPEGMRKMLETIENRTRFRDVGRLMALRLMIDVITERFGFEFQSKLAKLACYIDYVALLSLDKTEDTAKQINELLNFADAGPIFQTDLLSGLLQSMQSMHVRLVVEWTKNIFAMRYEEKAIVDFTLMNELNDHREFYPPDGAVDIVTLYNVFAQLRIYIETLQLCVNAYGMPKSKTLQHYIRFITVKYGLYDPVRFSRCVAMLDSIKENIEDIDAFVLETNAKTETMQMQIDTLTVENAAASYEIQQLLKQNPNTFIAAKLLSLLKYGVMVDEYEKEEQRLNAIHAFFIQPENSVKLSKFELKDVWAEPGYHLYRVPVETAKPLIKLLMQARRNNLQTMLEEIDATVVDKNSANYIEFQNRIQTKFAHHDFDYDDETHFAALVSNNNGRFTVAAYCIYSFMLGENIVGKLRTTMLRGLWMLLLKAFEKPGDAPPRYLFAIRHLHGEYLDILLYWLVDNPQYGDEQEENITIARTIHVPVKYDIAVRRVLGEGCRRKHEDLALIRSVDTDHYLTLAASLTVVPRFVDTTTLSNQIKVIAFHNVVTELEPNCDTRDKIDVWEITLYNSYVRFANSMVRESDALKMFGPSDGRNEANDWVFEEKKVREEVARRLKLKPTLWQKTRNKIRRLFGI